MLLADFGTGETAVLGVVLVGAAGSVVSYLFHAKLKEVDETKRVVDRLTTDVAILQKDLKRCEDIEKRTNTLERDSSLIAAKLATILEKIGEIWEWIHEQKNSPNRRGTDLPRGQD